MQFDRPNCFALRFASLLLPLAVFFASCSTQQNVVKPKAHASEVRIRRSKLDRVESDRPIGMVIPVSGVKASELTSNFGASRDGGLRKHEGLDIIAPKGREVLAAVSGELVSMRWNNLGGNSITLFGDDGAKYYFAHLDAYRSGLSEGDVVSVGEVIGYVGSTGNAKTPHLHFEIHPGGGAAVDPLPILQQADYVGLQNAGEAKAATTQAVYPIPRASPSTRSNTVTAPTDASLPTPKGNPRDRQ